MPLRKNPITELSQINCENCIFSSNLQYSPYIQPDKISPNTLVCNYDAPETFDVEKSAFCGAGKWIYGQQSIPNYVLDFVSLINIFEKNAFSASPQQGE